MRAALLLAGLALGQDPALEQRLDAGQPVVTARKELSAGHVDIGPRFVDGRWTLMVHDDAGGRPVWRHTDRTVLRVSDAARLEVPDDPAYAFLHTQPGAKVHVVPQTQNPDVVWVGWNTQDPEVMETIDRGVTMTLTGVEGPGSLVVYLQSGDFGEPKVLWDSTAAARPAWVDVNTHTHANWAFSKPGVYLARVALSAELIDGSTVSDTRELRFAVGSKADADEAFAATWRRAAVPVPTAAPPAEATGGSTLLPAGIAVVALSLIAALMVTVVRGNRAKRQARC